MTEKMFECSCCCHGVTVYSSDDAYGHEIDMIWWERGGSAWRMGMRLQHMWHLFWYGKPKFQNEIIMTPDEAKALGEHLVAEADRLKELAQNETRE